MGSAGFIQPRFAQVASDTWGEMWSPQGPQGQLPGLQPGRARLSGSSSHTDCGFICVAGVSACLSEAGV